MLPSTLLHKMFSPESRTARWSRAAALIVAISLTGPALPTVGTAFGPGSASIAQAQAIRDLPAANNPRFYEELRQMLAMRNIDETSFRSKLFERGIIIERLSPAQLLSAEFQATITSILNELETEIMQREADNSAPADSAGLNARAGAAGGRSALTMDGDSLRRTAFDSVAPDIFGHEIFRGTDPTEFVLQSGAEAPDSYVLDTGDRLVVTIFGVSQGDFLLVVNTDGYVQPAQMSKIFLRGMTYGDAKRMLRQRFSSAYTFQSDQFIVSMQASRSQTVQVLGEALRKGSITISAYNTVFNALYASGGPTEIGSVRAIQVVRGKTSRTFDLYELLRNPTGLADFSLSHQDIIFIPASEKVVRVEGAVQRPMRYELVAGETMADLIRFAGGLSADAYPEYAQIERFEMGEVALIDVPVSLAASTELRNGDIVRIRPSRKALDSRVVIAGAVYYPDTLGYTPGMTLGDALERTGGPLRNAADRAFLERRDPADSTQISYLPVRLSDPATMAMTLQPYDQLSVYDRTLYTNVGQVGITGAVKQAVAFDYNPDLSIEDLFLACGGFQLGAALNRVQVFRRIIHPDRQLTLDEMLISVDSTYKVIEPADFKLRPFDQIVVRLTPGFTLENTVEINGEVNFPGVYLLESRTTHFSELIDKAGGLRSQADPIGSLLFRTFGGRGYVVTNLDQALRNPGKVEFDPILMPGDVITINQRENTVTLSGQGINLRLAVDDTLAPSDQISVTYQGPRNAKWYVMNYGGGFSKDADLATVTVKLKNGQVLATRKTLFGRRYPDVPPGATIDVDLKPESEAGGFDFQNANQTFRETMTSIMQTTTTLVTLLVLVKQI